MSHSDFHGPVTVTPLPDRVSAFLEAYEAGPGAVAAHAAAPFDFSDAVARMEATTSPFCHGTIDDFLPLDTYKAVRSDWPAAADHESVALDGGDGVEPAYLGSRRTKLVEDWTRGGAASTASVWNLVSAALRAPVFVRTLFTEFADIVDANLEVVAGGSHDVAGFRLYLNRDHGGKEALGAHVDALRKLLTIVIYIDLSGPVTADSETRWGTTLYHVGTHDAKPVRFSSNADHAVARQIRFAPNRAFVMPNTRRSLHGVVGGEPSVTRRTMMCGYWLLGNRLNAPT